MVATSNDVLRVWRHGPAGLGLLLVLAAGLGWLFYDGLELMVKWWSNREEYSHGFLIPLISAFLIWQRKDELERVTFKGSWLGVAVALFGLFCFTVGELATLYPIIQYAFIITLAGCILALVGWQAFKKIWVPVAILFFMVPLPNFIYNNLSQELQLISSSIGVWVIRLFGISVFLEGNVIDLGSYKLQVVEACNGLRYLFPLMTLGFIMAYFFQAAFWKRAFIFFSTIPITVLMNSFRIGVIGVLVEYWGESQAEGFLHDFEGWVIFMACFGLLFVLMWLLIRVTGDKRALREVFGLEFPAPTPKDAKVQYRSTPVTLWVVMGLLIVALIPAALMPERAEAVPDRKDFIDFPMTVAGWQGRRDTMERQFVDALKFDDYILTNYRQGDSTPVNFYVAWYDSQRKGQSAHSPKACIPGGGWEITQFGQRQIDGAAGNGGPLSTNRAVIEYGNQKQLVYYWFQQRGRMITNEYLVKWYLFWDALTRNRTDGALVRLTTSVQTHESIEKAEQRLEGFARAVAGKLEAYIPG